MLADEFQFEIVLHFMRLRANAMTTLIGIWVQSLPYVLAAREELSLQVSNSYRS